MLLSDANASDFVERTEVRIFEDPGAGSPAWKEMEAGAVKHDSFVYGIDGERILFWDASDNSLANWSADIRAAVESQSN